MILDRCGCVNNAVTRGVVLVNGSGRRCPRGNRHRYRQKGQGAAGTYEFIEYSLVQNDGHRIPPQRDRSGQGQIAVSQSKASMSVSKPHCGYGAGIAGPLANMKLKV